ncbi:MAG: helix-turn-helix domain-containing protein [Rhodobiaceae bacterium]|nr:helix-turn-helix domain-containing protein [Rhodobiaceae bacterium]
MQAHIDWLEARVMELEASLPGEIEGNLRLAYDLTPTQARFLAAIARRDVLTRCMAMAVLYGGEPNPPDPKILDILMFHIRRAIGPDFHIEVLRGTGWRMLPAWRKRFAERFMSPADEARAA